MVLNPEREHLSPLNIVLNINFFLRKMDCSVKIIFYDEGSLIPKYILTIIKEILDNLVVKTESLPPKDCTGNIFTNF